MPHILHLHGKSCKDQRTPAIMRNTGCPSFHEPLCFSGTGSLITTKIALFDSMRGGCYNHCMQKPGYFQLLHTGELAKRAEQLFAMLAPCRLCPWQCGVDRTKGAKGRCRAGSTARVAKAVPHFGEEPVISGSRGSGTIFFSHCNLRCCFCQNYQISHEALGEDVTVARLSDMMLGLQEQGCHNINLVSAAQHLPFIVQALNSAAAQGLSCPIVYNSNGYEDVGVLRLLEGIVDVYLPDAKYADDENAQKYSGTKNYVEINMNALDEMFRQAGYVETDEAGIARKGLIVRHLVLPGGLAGTERILETLKKRFGRFLAVSLMGQYTPCYRSEQFPELAAKTTREEYSRAVAAFESLGFENGWTQELETLDGSFVPDFRKKDSWN